MNEQKHQSSHPKADAAAQEHKSETIAGTGKANENKSTWIQAAEIIAGNNKIMSNVLKIAFSPFGLIIALCGFGYLLWKNKTHKDKIGELQKELMEAKIEIKDLKKEVDTLEKIRRPQQITDYELDDATRKALQGHRNPIQLLSNEDERTTKRKAVNTKYFD